ncbi:hypothetical protein CFIO01_04389 [Colletotrichum fioriniae PJ7]|uniref:Uncharacterized protein n=1 Tax=Colletotrichum fioriniae PJ7 TaxID=1445577 RepID=A0A010S0I0_9PEZI|nr:hypothetical protein CFIO01_04389 [Colletotrichum fioriniae PJ7]
MIQFSDWLCALAEQTRTYSDSGAAADEWDDRALHFYLFVSCSIGTLSTTSAILRSSTWERTRWTHIDTARQQQQQRQQQHITDPESSRHRGPQSPAAAGSQSWSQTPRSPVRIPDHARPGLCPASQEHTPPGTDKGSCQCFVPSAPPPRHPSHILVTAVLSFTRYL